MKKFGLLAVMMMLVAVPALVLVGCGGGIAAPAGFRVDTTPAATRTTATISWEAMAAPATGTTRSFEIEVTGGLGTTGDNAAFTRRATIGAPTAANERQSVALTATQAGTQNWMNTAATPADEAIPMTYQGASNFTVRVRAIEVTGTGTDATREYSEWVSATWTRAAA